MLPPMGPSPLANLPRGRHACLLYTDAQEAIASVAPYLAAGLRAQERCVYVLGDHDPALVSAVLSANGIDVEMERQRGALVLLDQWDISFPNGVFDPVTMIAFVRQAIAEALGSGFTALRIAAEMTWTFKLGAGHNKLIHYEALGNDLYPHEPLGAICMYDRHRFPGEVCRDALRVHPYASTGDDVLDNIYYELPGTVINGASEEVRADWMLEQLRRLRDADAHRAEILQLRAAAAARDDLLSVLAHELKNPIAASAICAETALARIERGVPADDAGVRRALEVVIRQSQKQSRLIEHVLCAARMQKGELPLEPSEYDLASALRDSLELAQAGASDRVIQLEVPATAPVCADPARIDQVVNNLIDNAIKFSPPGSPIHVSLRELADGGYELSVRDFGPGIAPADRERIFERYQQALASHRGLGLGIGLHLCRELLRRHGGTIRAEAPEGGGACIVAELPRSAAEPASTAKAPKIVRAAG